jgi:hypothetical protein
MARKRDLLDSSVLAGETAEAYLDTLGPAERRWIKSRSGLPIEALGAQVPKDVTREIFIEWLDKWLCRNDSRWKEHKRVHRDAALAQARAKRDQWRVPDVQRLLDMGELSKNEQRHLARLLDEGEPGRGVVEEFKPLAEALFDHAVKMQQITDPATPAYSINGGGMRIEGRLGLMKGMWWWPQILAATYEGELALQRKNRGPVDTPEQRAASEVCRIAAIEPRKLRRLREIARQELKEGIRPHAPLMAADLKRMIETGELV